MYNMFDNTNGLNFQSQGANSLGVTPVQPDTWYTCICRIIEGEKMVCYINGIDRTSNDLISVDSIHSNIHIDGISVNAGIKYIDLLQYIVFVPDALTEEQMQSLYTNYETDIEGFLVENNLTPTVKYMFDNDNTNTGIASGLPAISFQSIDVYIDIEGTSIVPQIAPHINITNVSEVTSNQLTISGTIFSSVANVTEVKAAVFVPTVDLTQDNTVKTFVNTYGTVLTGVSANQYAVGAFTDFAFNTAFNSSDLTTDTTEGLVDGDSYSVVVIATDGTNIGIYSEIPIIYGDNGEIMSWIFDRYPTSDDEAESFSKATFISNMIPNPDEFKFTNFTLTQSAFRSSDGALNGDSIGINQHFKIENIPTEIVPTFSSNRKLSVFIETEMTFVSGHGQMFLY